MTVIQLLGLLLFKHGVLAQLIDFGYSASRRAGYRFWVVALALHGLAEMVGTLYILSNFPLSVVSVVLLVETAGHATTAVLERGAPLCRMMARHLYCEVSMIAIYAALAWFLA